MANKLSMDSYKGVRDFFPEDQFIQDYIFFVWETTLESFGYEKYNASVLEPSALYEAKSGQEIVNEQTYKFTDRGEREVTLRPEMTPTIARMVAQKQRELHYPVRWFSIPNLFRYERPQRGRLREHWQLNADIFGVAGIEAEVEMINIAATVLRNFGMDDGQFEIRINDISTLDAALTEAGLNDIEAHQYRKLLDKKAKISAEEFAEESKKIIGDKIVPEVQPSESVQAVVDTLKNIGVSNVSFSPTLVRGFDYYTGIVFEVFSTDEENNRSMFGGGRYDQLLSIFDQPALPAVGFGMGDVTTKDVLETYGLLPAFTPSAQLIIIPENDAFYNVATILANNLRTNSINVSVDYSGKKTGDQLKRAVGKNIPFAIILDDNANNNSKIVVKNLSTGKEKSMKVSSIASFVKKAL